MPRRTVVLLFVYVASIVACGAVTSRGRPGNFYSFAWEVKGISESALLSFAAVWATVASPPRFVRIAVVAAVAVFTVFEVVLSSPLGFLVRTADIFWLSAIPCTVGAVMGASLSGALMSYKWLALTRVVPLEFNRSTYKLRFSLRELFALSLVCATILGLLSVSSFDPDARAKFMLAFTLLSAPVGLMGAVAAWAMLLPLRPLRRLSVGLPICAIPFLLLVHYSNPTWGIMASGSLVRYALLLYLIQLVTFWTLRSAGYRLVWRENHRQDGTSAAIDKPFRETEFA